MIQRISAKTRGLAVVATVVVVAAAAACKSLTGVPANLSTISDTGTVYAINGSPPGAPTALHLLTASLLAADPTFFFDVAFDIDTAGNPVFLPQRAVASGLSSTHGVGLQRSEADFDAIGSAPKNGYRADTALVVRVGETVLVQSTDPTACALSITGSSIYAKVVVTGVDTEAHTLAIRYTIDPNCGFLSFGAGVPKE